ncbi:putative ribonuclease H-like domain-containing protein [Tanacetum coccineum]
MPPTHDLSFTSLDEFVNEPVVENSKAMSSKEEPKVVRKNDDAPIIEEWVSDDEEEDVSQHKTEKGKKFNTARPKAIVNDVKGNNLNAVKASAYWVWKPKHKVLDHGNPQIDLQDQGVIDSGCSRHMKENMSYLTDYEEIDGGYLIDESQVLLRVPRKNNPYSVDLKNIVPKGGLTILFAKATSDESKHWHRRLGHLNYKTMNKLVKGILVRGLPSKLFENDQTCIACEKGKQHKTSFVTDDYSRFTWVLFIAAKEETSGILKSFITEIENLVDHKGIFRQFSVARTPQQNGVAERRNGTLIEATRTMLVDSKLSTSFWAEVVNTVCYVQNRVLVVKPHNKTPYELFHGTKASDNIGQARKETEHVKDYILLSLWTADPPYSQDPKSSHDDGFKPSSDDGKKVNEDLR